MIVKAIKTRILVPPQDDLLACLSESIKTLKERSVVVVTSKVVSIWEGRCVPTGNVKDKDELIRKEADHYLERDVAPEALVMHTIKNNIFIPSAGIDESNAKNHYILWPKDSKKSAKKIWEWLRSKYKLREIGVIISDSHTIPARRGAMGISLAHYGFNPLRDYRGAADLFGRELKMSQTDVADGLAAAAVLVMGEGKEGTPVAVIEDGPGIEFVAGEKKFRKGEEFELKSKYDLYWPLFSAVRWKKGGGGKKLDRVIKLKRSNER